MAILIYYYMINEIRPSALCVLPGHLDGMEADPLQIAHKCTRRAEVVRKLLYQ